MKGTDFCQFKRVYLLIACVLDVPQVYATTIVHVLEAYSRPERLPHLIYFVALWLSSSNIRYTISPEHSLQDLDSTPVSLLWRSGMVRSYLG